MELVAVLRADLSAAMKARDTMTVRVLRTVLSAIANAEAVPVAASRYEPSVGVGSTELPRQELSAEQVDSIVVNEIDERRHLAEDLRARGRHEEAQLLESEIAIVERYRRPAQ
jgi:uncharacterized protein YqeY